MVAVLGVSAHYHDSAVALVVDGRLVAAVQEERLSRVKNDSRLPRLAMRECLRLGGVLAAELTCVRYYEEPFGRLERVLTSVLRHYPASFRVFPRAMAAQVGDKIWVRDQLAEALDLPRARVEMGSHHHSHAASAFFCSPFEEAAVISVDGVGELASTAIWQGRGDDLRCIECIDFPHSLGLFYAAITAYLGFEVNEGEYKVMGLAAYGTPRFTDEFARILCTNTDGSYELGLDYFSFETDAELGFSSALENMLGPRREPRARWRLSESNADRRYADIAASAQAALERGLFGLARRARERTGSHALCLAGGVALNAVANARLAEQGIFERVFVQPAAGDAGGAVGAALAAAIEHGDPRPPGLESVALGSDIDASEAFEMAGLLGLRARRVSDPARATADLLAEGRVVGFAQGRFELGPRALGQRSILALPGDVRLRDRINSRIKSREPFRPFAPCVLAARAGEWFHDAPNEMTPFMTTVCRVRDGADLGAVTHIDGTARVQTVEPRHVPELGGVLELLASRGLPPVLLNTSLNGPGEPIAATASDAVAFLAVRRADALVVGDVVVERS